ncbi:MAG: enoyl-CoA hydratase/isomerase family protein [Acidimicrobiia bacterium]|nr:enoyl-CoA hydratase/isomerase family protein [Acidimicrobiia bacterium]
MLLCDVDDGVATLTFNNPTKRNALSAEIRGALPRTLRSLQADPDVRVVVLTGAGEKAFVSGADISEFAEQRTSPEARQAYDATFADADRAWSALEKPIIAMIRGFCIGGGLLTAMKADIRIAADDAQFGVPAARLGLGYGYAGIETLVGLIGPAHTSELLFSARRYTAAEAMHMGLVNRVVAVDELRDAVVELARTICANAPLTVAACKAGVQQVRRDPERRDLDKVAAMVEACFRSEDYREGQAAFLAKRTPDFRGR